MTTSERAVLKNWGRQLFEERYLSRVLDLFSAFSNSSGLTISMFINDDLLMVTAPDSSDNTFCPGVRSSAWGRGRCIDEDQQQVAIAFGESVALEKRTCWAGLENIISGFDLPGLGKITIVCGRIPPITPASISVRLDQLVTEMPSQSAEIAAAREHAETLARPLRLELNLILFEQLVLCTKNLCSLGIETHLSTRSSLHELTLSLAAITGATDFVLDKAEEVNWTSDVRDCISSIGEHVHLARSLAVNLLEYYGIGHDVSVGESLTMRIDLVEEVESLAKIWEPIAAERNIEIRRELKTQAIIRGNRSQIRQVFHNLISNAVKYSYSTSERGERRFVSISFRSHDPGFREPRVSIRISNYGVGIMPEEFAHLGEPGFRGYLARQEQPVGLGIGLFVAKQIVQRHGGEIKFESQYLHDTERRIRARTIKSKTYRTECLVVFPVMMEKGVR